jgi:hypothetical protein
MSEKPDDLPDWAEDDDYPAGSDDWSAQPNKVEPSAGEKGTGFVPQDELAIDILNWLLNNRGAWIKHHEGMLNGRDFRFDDHFVGDVVDDGRWTTSISGGGNGAIIVDDSVNGGFGALSIGGNSSGNAAIATQSLPVGGEDFWLQARIRVPAYSASGFQIGFPNASASDRCYLHAENDGNWFVNVADVETDLGVAPASGFYQFISLRRKGGVLKVFIADVEKHSVSFAAAFTAPLQLNVDCVPTMTTVMLDDVTLWIDR